MLATLSDSMMIIGLMCDNRDNRSCVIIALPRNLGKLSDLQDYHSASDSSRMSGCLLVVVIVIVFVIVIVIVIVFVIVIVIVFVIILLLVNGYKSSSSTVIFILLLVVFQASRPGGSRGLGCG